MRDLWVTISHTSGAKVYSMVVGVFVLSLTARILGPEGRGQIAAILTWAGLFSTVVYLSLGQVALHRMSEDKQQRHFGTRLGSLLLLTIIFTSVGWAIALVMYLYTHDGIFKELPIFPLIVGFLALPFLIWEQYGSNLLMGLDRINIYNRYQIIGRTVSLVAVFILVGGLGFGIIGVLWATLLGQATIAIGGIGFLFAFARSKKLVCKPNATEIKALIAGGLKLHFNAIGTFLFTSINLLILNSYHGPEQTGYFQLSMQLIGILTIIPQAAGIVIYSKASTLGANGAWPINRRLLLHISIGSVFISIFAAMLAPWGITLLAGNEFKPAVAPFQWMLLGLIGITFSTIMAPQWIIRGYFWQASGITLFVGLVSLVTNYLLIPSYGIWGAVYAYLGTYGFSVFGNGFMAYHCQKEYKKSL